MDPNQHGGVHAADLLQVGPFDGIKAQRRSLNSLVAHAATVLDLVPIMESKSTQDIAALNRRFEIDRAWHVCPKLEAEIVELFSSSALLLSSSFSSFAFPFSVLGIAVIARVKYPTVIILLPSVVVVAVVVRRTT